MMDLSILIFGDGKDLTIFQMTCRGLAVFFIALGLIRVSGRRSFGIRTALDNIISILLGAVLSRAVVGASPFLPVIFTCLVIVLLHRLLAWISTGNKRFGSIIEGNKILLFEDGKFIKENLARALVCEEDIMQGIRRAALTEDITQIERVYMERNGEITAIKK
jgi:uncharacterized membrane protein YcaP (DUF421 family)